MSTGYTTLVDARTLGARLKDPGWRVIDCRHDLTDPDFGRRAYAAGHIPGAGFLHLDEDLSSPCKGSNGRHPLPDPQRLAERLGAVGIAKDTQVVAYDDAGGMFASRLWWLLRWLGHERVAVLDGGLQAWGSTCGALETAAATPAPRPFVPEQRNGRVDVAYVLAHLGAPDLLLVDARSPDRFRGENETLDPVGGHIPGARNRFFRDNLGPTGCFKSADELRAEFAALLGGRPASEIVHQCGSGVTACHNLLAMELAGLSGSRLYAGSWSEWCTDPARPVATGAAD